MHDKPIVGFFVDPLNMVCEPREIVDRLDEFYKLLDCRTIDIVSRSIGGFVYDIICDDEGLFKQDPVPSAVLPDGTPALVGSLFIVNCPIDDEGELESLAFPQIDKLLSACVVYQRKGKYHSAILLDPF